MSATVSLVEEQAIAWTIRTRDADFDDWISLTEWLEEDAAHATAFQRLSSLDDILPNVIPAPRKRQWHEAIVHSTRWPVARLGGVAAAFVAVIALGVFMAQPSYYSVETAPGERRTVALEDGSRIDLNGNTKIILSKDDIRHAVLDRGEALFTVVHNERDPFIVEVGDAVVQDAGTVFNIIQTEESTEVGVAEGLVIYNPEKERVSLKPGYALRVAGRGNAPETFVIPTAVVGSWQRYQLIYNDALIERIAADLSRSLGTQIAVSKQITATRFTGTINLKKDPEQFFTEIAPVLGVKARPTKNGWILVGSDEARR